MTIQNKPTIYKAPTVYNLVGGGGGGGGGAFLPDGYRKVSYIQTDGTAYADHTLDEVITCTTRQMNVNVSFDSTIAGQNYDHVNCIAAFDENDLFNSYCVQIRGDGYITPGFADKHPNWSEGWDFMNNYYDTNKLVVNMKNANRYLYSNLGSKYMGYSNFYNNIKRVFLFGTVGTGSGTPCPMRLLDSFILDASNDKVVFTFLPCYEIATGLYGFFDVIGGKFYTATTGTFTGGL